MNFWSLYVRCFFLLSCEIEIPDNERAHWSPPFQRGCVRVPTASRNSSSNWIVSLTKNHRTFSLCRVAAAVRVEFGLANEAIPNVILPALPLRLLRRDLLGVTEAAYNFSVCYFKTELCTGVYTVGRAHVARAQFGSFGSRVFWDSRSVEDGSLFLSLLLSDHARMDYQESSRPPVDRLV